METSKQGYSIILRLYLASQQNTLNSVKDENLSQNMNFIYLPAL